MAKHTKKADLIKSAIQNLMWAYKLTEEEAEVKLKEIREDIKSKGYNDAFMSLGDFDLSSEENFPKDECVVQSELDKDVFYGKDVYCVIMYDDPQYKENGLEYWGLRVPCVHYEGELVTFGWADMENKKYIDKSMENSYELHIPRYTQKIVLGMRKLDEEELLDLDKPNCIVHWV